MGRPTDRGERRSEVINLRVTPTLKAKLEAHARTKGRKLSTECETRLVASMAESERPKSSPETVTLLSEIEAAIEEIELASGNKWHEGVATWAAVAEMLAEGPIMARTPAHMGAKDQKLAGLFQRQLDLSERRNEVGDRLNMFVLPPHLIWSLFYSGDRTELRDYIDSAGLPDAIRAKGAESVDELEAIDAEDDAVRAAVSAIVEPYKQAIEDGRALLEKPTKALALTTALMRLRLEEEEKRRPKGGLPRFTTPINSLAGGLGGLFGHGRPRTVGYTLGDYLRDNANGNDSAATAPKDSG